LFVLLSAYGFRSATADPTRVAAQIVSGIGFLGAGVILRDGLNDRGLNTAATLWCSAAVGAQPRTPTWTVASVTRAKRAWCGLTCWLATSFASPTVPLRF
jgi:putative Mg2+ transporter-C (MgtC) family protein